MPIVDSHVHIWATGTPNTAHRQVPALTGEQLIAEMQEAGVDAAVIQPPAWDPTSNEVAVEAARRHPDRYAILGWFPLDDPEGPTRVEHWTGRPGMLGLRFTFPSAREEAWLTDGSLDWLWPAVEETGMPLSLAAGNFLPLVGRIAERHPALRLSIDHLGMPLRQKDDAALANLPDVLALANYPNVAVKASAAPGASTQPYPFRNIHDYLRAVYDAFGPRRMFWGTDITRMPCSWRECVTMFTEELDWLPEADKELVMGRALCEWIGWDLPG